MYKTDVFISAEEIKEIVGISKSKAYSLIQELNAELKENHFYESTSISESFSIVSLSLQNSPKAFHWSIVDTFSNSRHALYYSSIYKFCMKCPVCILESPVTVKQWLRTRISK